MGIDSDVFDAPARCGPYSSVNSKYFSGLVVAVVASAAAAAVFPEEGVTCATLGRYRNASAAFRMRIGPVGIDDDEVVVVVVDPVVSISSSSGSLPRSPRVLASYRTLIVKQCQIDFAVACP